jgi:RNA polymerase sigma-70 factor (ECF subfamily)
MATRELDRIFEEAEPARAPNPDRELTLSFQRGDKWAYDVIFRRHSSRVHGLCQRMLSDPQEAQDAAQETFLRVYQALPRFNGQYQLGAWINRIATNVCLDYLRSRSRTPADSTPNETLEEQAEASDGDSPEEVLMRSVEGMRVHETLASLSPLHRRAITMRDLEGRDYRDIATTLGVPEARARVLLHRARKGFKKSWASASIFVALPTRLLHRVRRFRDPGVTEPLMEAAAPAAQASHTLASSASLASSCQAVHGCGAVVSERIAAAATAALVGVGVTATGGVSLAPTGPKELAKPAPVIAQESPLAGAVKGAVDVAEATAGRVGALAGGVVEGTTDAAGQVIDAAAQAAGDAAAAVGGGETSGADASAVAPADQPTSGEEPISGEQPTGQTDAEAPGASTTPADAVVTDPGGVPVSTDVSPDAGVGIPVENPSVTPTPEPTPSGGDATSGIPDTSTPSPGEETPASEEESGVVDEMPPSGEESPADEVSPSPTPTPSPSTTDGAR